MVLPKDAVAALAAINATPASLEIVTKAGPPRPIRSYRTENHVLTLASSRDGQRLIELEVRGRQWSEAHGIPSCHVLASDPECGWMLAEWINAQPPRGPDYVDRCLDAADRLMTQAPPPDMPQASSWRAPTKGRLARVAHLARSRVPLWRIPSARRRVELLEDVATAHGDFYFRNLLNDGRAVRVIDWEFLGQAPRYTDHLRFWSTLKGTSDRDRAFARIVETAGTGQWSHVRDLATWLALRLLAENASVPTSQRNASDLAHARVVNREARELARSATPPTMRE